MEKEYNSQQLELFSKAPGINQTKAGYPRAFINYISRYERLVLIVIGFIVTGIISFSLGVEKGKGFMMLKTGAQLDIAAKPKPPSRLTVSMPNPKAEVQQNQPVKTQELKENVQSYTIQVASFSKRMNAQKEADILKRKGLSALILPKGGFTIVCVGNFSKREEAESLSSKLRKQYQDCRVRRL